VTDSILYGSLASEALELIRHRALTDFHAFAELVMKDNEGEPIRQATIHRTWIAHVYGCWEYGRFPGVFAPFDHGKSVQLVVGLVAWELAKNVNLRVKVVSNTDQRAMDRVMAISAILRDPLYRLLFPHVREVPKESGSSGKQAKWTQHEIFLDRPGFSLDASVQAAGVTSAGTGGRADLLLFDDIVDQRNAIDEPKMRDKVANNVNNVWMQRAEPDARVGLIGTMWHQDDYHHRAQKNEKWCVLSQKISEDFNRIDQELFHAFPEHPLVIASQQVQSRRRRRRRPLAA
jgi:hypothetical protein